MSEKNIKKWFSFLSCVMFAVAVWQIVDDKHLFAAIAFGLAFCFQSIPALMDKRGKLEAESEGTAR